MARNPGGASRETPRAIERVKEEAAAAGLYAELLADTLRESVMLLDDELRVVAVNSACLETFGVARDDVLNRLLPELGERQWNIPQLLDTLLKILPQKTELKNFEVARDFPGIGQRVMLLNARQVGGENGAPIGDGARQGDRAVEPFAQLLDDSERR